jgi:1-acyl-sn-glycerol-3-phosphate acyltransferase
MRRYSLARAAARLITRLYARVLVEGLERLPDGPAILCFSHPNWSDPLFLLGWLPKLPRTYLYGPEQHDMTRGFRNFLMRWSGVAIPYQPGKRGLLAATRRTQLLLAQGARVALAGEGRIHVGEVEVLPLLDGPAYYALLAGVPVVPIAINGTSWLGFRRLVRVRVGSPIDPPAEAVGQLTAAAVAALTARTWAELKALVADYPEQLRPGPLGRWLTELFNDWPEGSRPKPGARAPVCDTATGSTRRQRGSDRSRH